LWMSSDFGSLGFPVEASIFKYLEGNPLTPFIVRLYDAVEARSLSKEFLTVLHGFEMPRNGTSASILFDYRALFLSFLKP
jgi:hypothetical protein